MSLFSQVLWHHGFHHRTYYYLCLSLPSIHLSVVCLWIYFFFSIWPTSVSHSVAIVGWWCYNTRTEDTGTLEYFSLCYLDDTKPHQPPPPCYCPRFFLRFYLHLLRIILIPWCHRSLFSQVLWHHGFHHITYYYLCLSLPSIHLSVVCLWIYFFFSIWPTSVSHSVAIVGWWCYNTRTEDTGTLEYFSLCYLDDTKPHQPPPPCYCPRFFLRFYLHLLRIILIPWCHRSPWYL